MCCVVVLNNPMSDITLVCISNINHRLTEFAVNKSYQNSSFSETLIVSDAELPGIKYYHRWIPLDRINPYRSRDGGTLDWNFDLYNIFLLKDLVHHIRTSHILNIHYDGFPVNRRYWSDSYLQWDYIGSPTSRDWYPLEGSLREHDLYGVAPEFWYNGGGGFTLRSRRLLEALLDPRISTELSDKNFQRSEDVTISIKYRRLLEEEYGIKFAPLEVCMSFCTELLTGLPYSFGFHGWSNIPLFLSQEECIWYVDNLTRRDIFPGSPMVKRYIAACVLSDYYGAIDHINALLRDSSRVDAMISGYSR